MPGNSDHPVTLGDLFVKDGSETFISLAVRPATVADLMSPEIRPLVVSALRAEGVLVRWCEAHGSIVRGLKCEFATSRRRGALASCRTAPKLLVSVAEAQPTTESDQNGARDVAELWPCIHGFMYSHVLSPEPIVCVGRPAEAQPFPPAGGVS